MATSDRETVNTVEAFSLACCTHSAARPAEVEFQVHRRPTEGRARRTARPGRRDSPTGTVGGSHGWSRRIFCSVLCSATTAAAAPAGGRSAGRPGSSPAWALRVGRVVAREEATSASVWLIGPPGGSIDSAVPVALRQAGSARSPPGWAPPCCFTRRRGNHPSASQWSSAAHPRPASSAWPAPACAGHLRNEAPWTGSPCPRSGGCHAPTHTTPGRPSTGED